VNYAKLHKNKKTAEKTAKENRMAVAEENQKYFSKVFILVPLFLLFFAVAPVFSQTPQLGQPTLLQQALNRLPAIPVAGQTLKFDFGGEIWIAKLNGKGILAGSITQHDTNEGSILVLKQTHAYVGIAWVKTPGADIILEYKQDPPASLRSISKSDLDAKLASAGVPSSPAGQMPPAGLVPIAGQVPTAASAQSAQGYDDEKDFTVETINEDSAARITRYGGKNTELRIPPRIGDRPVTEIGERVFTKKGLTSVAIPESVVFIGNLAFAENQIGSISIGANVYIANNAFDGSGYNPSFVGFYNNQGRRAGTYSNSWRFVSTAAPQPVYPASGSAVPAGTPGVAASAAPSDPTIGSVEVISPTSGWKVSKDPKSRASMSINKEQIDGREWDVLAIDANVVSNGWAGVDIFNIGLINQKLQNANGVRFKVLGDGKRWRVLFTTSNVTDGNYHGTIISTQRGKVISVDVPFSRVRQGDWGRKTAFNNNNITGLAIQRTNDTGLGASAIKVFDFEIY
jgi:hypothetical protein